MSANAPVEDLFSFSTALELLKQGSCVSRSSWTSGRFLKLNGKVIDAYTDNCKPDSYIALNKDLLATDWQEVPSF